MKIFRALSVVLCVGLLTCADDDRTSPSGGEAVDQQALSPGAQVLLVVGNATLSSGDAAIRSRLQALQATVVVRTGAAAQSADATGKALVVISDSVTSSDVNTKFRNSAVPVLCLENALFDDMLLTGAASGTDFGSTSGQTEVTLTAVSHPIAAGLNVPVVSSAQTFAWGVPAGAATKIATIAGNTNRAAVFVHESGAALFSGTAPARRAGFFAAGSAPAAFTTQGGKLFDNTVQWLTAGCSSSAQCPGTANGSATCTGGICGITCNVGFHLCGGSCLSNSSVASCGASCSPCAVPANGTATCSAGLCAVTCSVGFHLCGGTCANNSSVTSCGTSCTACAMPANGTAICSAGLCAVVCNVGFKLCGGACIPISSAC